MCKVSDLNCVFLLRPTHCSRYEENEYSGTIRPCILFNYSDLYLVDDMVEKSEDEEAIGKLSVDEQDEVISNTNYAFVLH